MIVVINLISLFQGGPKTVGYGILEGLADLETDHEFHLILPSGVGFETYFAALLPSASHLVPQFVPYPTVRMRYMYKLFFDHIYTAWYARKLGAHVLFMTANFPSLLSWRPQLVLEHNSFYLMPNAPRSRANSGIRFRLECILFRLGTRKCKQFLVQLVYYRELLCKGFNIPRDQIEVVTMVPLKGFREPRSGQTPTLPERKDPTTRRLFFPAKFHPNKNHHLLLPLARHARANGWKLEIFITLDSSEGNTFLQAVRNEGLDGIIQNLGMIPNEQIYALYRQMDGLFFPTAAESYGLPLVEALLSHLPILTTDFPFTREVCGQAAHYFDLRSESSLLETTTQFLANLENGALRPAVDAERERFLHGWSEVMVPIIKRLETLAASVRAVKPAERLT